MYGPSIYNNAVPINLNYLGKIRSPYLFHLVKISPQNDRRSISRNVAHLGILVHDVINLFYYVLKSLAGRSLRYKVFSYQEIVLRYHIPA